MRLLKRSVTIALLLFVGATVGMLIAQEVSHKDAVPIEGDRDVSTGELTEPVDAVEASDGTVASVEEAATVGVEDSSAPGFEDTEAETVSTAVEPPESEPPCVVDAIYFHNTLRCRTCKSNEETTKAVVEEEFAEEFAAGRLRWSAINMERQQHYVEEFDLVKPTLILVRTAGEEPSDWVALDETWSLIQSELRFADYVETETRAFLEACP